MSLVQRITTTLLALLLAAALWGLWSTRDPAVAPASAGATAKGGVPQIDESMLVTAQRLARMASTPEEQPLAQAAVQTADHELDLAFMGALHAIQAHPPELTPEAQKIEARIEDAQKRLAADTDTLADLARRMGQASEAQKADLQDQLDLVGSQIEIEKDEIEEANDDLMAAGGNVHQRIQKAQEEHLAAERNTPPPTSPPSASSTALSSLHGMVAQFRQWLGLHGKRRTLEAARHAAADSAAELAKKRAEIAAELASVQQQLQQAGGHAGGNGTSQAQNAQLELTRRFAIDQRRLMVRDRRIAARTKLADIYGRWDGVVAGQQRAVLREWLVGASVVVAALLLLLFADRWLNHLLGRARGIDRRQLATLQSVIGVALQVIAVVLILFMLVGVPGQIATVIGIVGAGLTVALKDFIVAFIGWFVLMGKNGIRVGDWVEIKGVSGEVVELSVFHTVLLETGNWTDAGHPTGRRVTFTNSFAIEGHYFNFSTTGQWLWDELTLVVPFSRDPHAVAAAIQKEVTAATAESTQQAEQEWQRASRGARGTSLSAQPAIAVRPAVGGVEIAVRYVTRASDRYALRAKLYQAMVPLLAEKPA